MSRFEQLESVFARASAVAAAWVFGSEGRGEARLDSDLDIAVLLSDPAATALTHRRELFELAAQLESASQRRVDLVILTLRDPIIAHRVLSEGVLVHDANPRRRLDFTADAIARYFDWAPKYEAAAARSLKSNRAWAHGESR